VDKPRGMRRPESADGEWRRTRKVAEKMSGVGELNTRNIGQTLQIGFEDLSSRDVALIRAT